MGVLDTLDTATPLRKSVDICLDGSLQAEWDRESERLEEAARRDTEGQHGSLAMPETRQVVDKLDGIRDRMLASTVWFEFERIPWEKRIALQAEHPPRAESPVDQIRGYNLLTYFPALVRASCLHATDHEGDQAKIPDEKWDRLLGKGEEPGSLNLKQVNRLVDAAQHVNDGETAVPPSARSLLGSQDFGASLAQPSPGTSAPSGSEDGSRPTSPRSSTTKKKARSKAGSGAT